jgi:hypothetical protein
MAVTLDDTPKSATANTYASRSFADTYHESHIDSAGTWAGATDAEKDIALVMATRLLDAKYEWHGVATDEDQVLQWPRTGLLDYIRRSSLNYDTYPTQLAQATSEMARLLLASDTTGELAQVNAGLTQLTAGSITMKFKESGILAKPIPDSVRDLIPYWWGYIRGAGISRPIVRA